MNLSEKFNQQEFINWIEKFLPNFSNDHRKVDIPNGLTGVTSISTLGESALGVRVFIIETEKDPSGRKIGLAKESFNLIKNYGTPNALIAYYSKESSKWRLSLLTSTPEWSDGKIITKLSNPKRQSYVLGEDAKVNTPTRFLLKKDAVTDITDLKSRFSLEVVNKEFYKEISESFIKLVGGTTGTGRNQKKYESLLKLPSVTDHSQTSIEFAVRLIGRIIFCWFLREKKGPDGTSLMPKELLSLEAIEKNPDYYHKVLEPIFFEVLNQPAKSRKDLFYGKPYSLIPYLNGGLFSPHKPDDFYERKNGDLQSRFHNTLIIPDSWFVELFKTLETYNFTIDENTSFDEELSIDPEMLGRIFENLLAEINPETGESARKSTGSYYTPRVIVDYMIDESLLLYLKQQTGVEENKLRAIISYDLTDDLEYSLEQSEKEKVINALEKIKILDPACGSGAFPIGALQKTVFILQQVDPNGQLWFNRQMKNVDVEFKRDIQRRYENKEYNYIRKLGLIRESIYGIDIQPIATEISRLRCFLTLIVDQTVNNSENRGIKPLPNLEFKFVTANSLIGLPKLDDPQTSLFDDTSLISELKDIRDQFFNSSGIEREQLKHEFAEKQNDLINDLIKRHSYTGVAKAELTSKLTSWKPFKHQATDWFDPEWMFGIKDGFDIVIANPPYVRQETIKSIKPELQKQNYEVFNSTSDLYTYFYELSYNLLKNKGVLTFITSNKWMRAKYGKKLRKFFRENTKMIQLVDFNGHKVFEATVDTNIIVICKDKVSPTYSVPFVNILENFTGDSLSKYITSNQESIELGYLNDSGWSLIDEKTLKVKHKIENIGKVLKNWDIKIKYGVKTGFNKAFIIDNSVKDHLCDEDPKCSKLFKPILRGKDIQKYKYTWNKLWLIKIESGWTDKMRGDKDPEEFFKQHYPSVYKHLLKHKRQSGKGKGLVKRDDQGRYWWELRDCDYYEDFEKDKIIYTDIAKSLTFAYDTHHYYLANTAYFLSGQHLKYLFPLLNSQLMNWYYKNISSQLGKNGIRHFSIYIEQLPIPEISEEAQKDLKKIVDEIHNLTKTEDNKNKQEKINKLNEFETQLDHLVYKIYDLDDHEIELIEKSKNK